MKERRK